MDFNLENLSSLASLISAWGAAFLAALWLALIYWTLRDANSRMRMLIPRFLSTLLVIGLFIPGVLIYLIIRPKLTIEEEYMRTLEEEALLRAIEKSEALQDDAPEA